MLHLQRPIPVLLIVLAALVAAVPESPTIDETIYDVDMIVPEDEKAASGADNNPADKEAPSDGSDMASKVADSNPAVPDGSDDTASKVADKDSAELVGEPTRSSPCALGKSCLYEFRGQYKTHPTTLELMQMSSPKLMLDTKYLHTSSCCF